MANAPDHGVEPQFSASKADVLPLDESGKLPIIGNYHTDLLLLGLLDTQKSYSLELLDFAQYSGP